MKRTHAITPTDSAPKPNPLWEYSKPQVSRDGKTVAIDAMQYPMLVAYYDAMGVPPVPGDWREPRDKKR
jgi:hypothetical protein